MTDPLKTNTEMKNNSVLKKKNVVPVDNVLNRVILIIAVLTSLGLIATLLIYQRKIGSTLIILALLMTMVMAKLLMQRGQVRLASICAVSGVWFIFSFIILLGGGLENINVVFFISTTVWAGLLLGERAAIQVAGVGVTLGFVLALMAIFGYLPSPYFLSSPLSDWVQLVFALVLTASTLNLALRDRDNALNMANKQLSDRLEAEEALRESEKQYRIITEKMSDIVWIADMNLRTVYVTPSVQAVLGFTQEERMLQTVDQQFTPDSLSMGMEAMARELALEEHGSGDPGRKKTLVLEYYHKDGSTRWMDTTISGLRNDQGVLTGLHGVSREITERKRAEEALTESEHKYRLVVENAGEAILIAQDGMLKYVNPMTSRFLGYSEEELISKPFIEFIHPEEREKLRVAHSKIMQNEAPDPVRQFRVICKDGAIRWADSNAVLISWKGKPATLNFLTDITERKKLEQQLSQSRKMEALGTLAGGIAHDFNNLLMGIQGYASLSLINLDPSDPNYERLKSIEVQVQSGADLSKQLLGFAQGGRYEIKPTDMNNIIKKTSSMFGRTKKEISIHQKYWKGPCIAEVDRGQMEQVFMNLYVNAWQAMPGGGDIYIETENVLIEDNQSFPFTVKPGKYVKISVADTGTGMDEKTLERIFDPFFTTKRMGRGTGLGLATVYGIIKGHKGMIHVDSDFGHGTTFHIYLPASEKEVVPEKMKTETVARGTETILIVDDEKMILEVSKELLESLGYRVYPAGSGQEAIAVYMEKQKEIDLVILDMIMPGISGGETYDRFRKINPTIKVLLSSGYSINGEAKHILERGCNGFLQKPFHLEKLSRKVREILN